MSSKHPTWIALFLILVFAGLFYAMGYWADVGNIQLDSYPTNREEVILDNVATSIVNGNGFQLDFQSLEWSERYPANAKTAWIFAEKSNGITTICSPGFPYYLAGHYRMFGDNLSAVRRSNAAILAFGLAILLLTISLHFGWLAGFVAAVSLSFDKQLMTCPSLLLSESVAAGLFALTFSVVIWSVDHTTRELPAGARRNPWRWGIAGMLFGLTLLFQAPMQEWLLKFVLVVGIWIGYRAIKGRPIKHVLGPLVAFLIATIFVCFPWWARNCKTSLSPTPFGNGRTMNMVGGFSDSAVANGGNLSERTVKESKRQLEKELDMSEMGLPEKEDTYGMYSREIAFEWIGKNTGQLPTLTLKKILNHLGLNAVPQQAIFNAMLLIGAFIGCLLSWSQFGRWAMLAIGLSIVTTALTWSMNGQYFLPVKPLLHAATGIGVALALKSRSKTKDIDPIS